MINDELLHKWINNTISEKELESFKSRPEYESLKNLYKQTENLSTPDIDTEGILQKILATNKDVLTTEKALEGSKTNKKIIPLFLKIAAAACILFAAATLFFPKATMIHNVNEEQLAKNLPDGSKFILYANSFIEYQSASWDKERKIKLIGKAYFDVQKGNSFVVNTKKGQVKVLGTKFYVDDQKNIFNINCEEGKVEVQPNNSQVNVILTANESITIYNDGSSILRKAEMTKLKNVTLEQIITEIEDVFEVTFDANGIDLNKRLTSGFQHDNVDNAIKTIVMPLKLTYEKEGSQVTLKSL